MGDENSGLGRVVDAIRSIHQLTHLQKRCPHGPLATRDGGPALTVVEQLVHDHSTAKTEEAKLHAADIEQSRVSFIYNVQVVDLVFAGTELLEDLDILTGSPYGVDRYVERVRLV